jgi:hypothetical protein
VGGHHEARDGRTITIWRLFGFILGLHRDEFYGEMRVKFRAGLPVGQVHTEQDRLVEQLPTPTADQMHELLKGVSLRA